MDEKFPALPLKLAYDSGIEDVLTDFYIPLLSCARHYDRIAGFFSSSTLALSARGFEEFITHGGTMRLVTCPRLSAADIAEIEENTKTLGDVLSESFISEYSQIEDEFQRDHVKALGWMLRQGHLEIKIAVLQKNGKLCTGDQMGGLMHQKVGILSDAEGNVLSFSGSNNESASGWMENTEEFKVFKGWDGGSGYISEDQKKFADFWEEKRPDVIVRDIPSAIREHLLRESQDFEPDKIAIKRYTAAKARASLKDELSLFFYQKNAVKAWEENDRALLIQMATGCGKTRTAIKCLDTALRDTKKLLVVIACPQVILASQWKTEIEKFNLPEHKSIEINGGVPNWSGFLDSEYRKLRIGRYKKLVIYTTHDTCSSEKFVTILDDENPQVTKFLIGDEVHGMGATKAQKGLLPCYRYRIGLSATPQRWFDDQGSERISKYFNDHFFEFSIQDALTNFNPITGKSFLVNFFYEPCFVPLEEEEIEEYRRLTARLSRCQAIQDSEISEYLQTLRFKRANITKNAEGKYKELERILNEIGPSISKTLIFVSPEQMDRVLEILRLRNISSGKFTEELSTKRSDRYNGLSEREYAVQCFKEEKYKVLVAIKCLDEGIDIPTADTAILMASSTNPREFIQRVGRVIRQAEGKGNATIYDFVIEPSRAMCHNDLHVELEKRIFEKEMVRVMELARNALNNVSVLKKCIDIRRSVFQ